MVGMPVQNNMGIDKGQNIKILVSRTKEGVLSSSHLISEDNSTFEIIFLRMDPCIRREENGTCIKTMNNNLQQVELLAVKIGNEHSSRIPKVIWNSEISCILSNVSMV